MSTTQIVILCVGYAMGVVVTLNVLHYVHGGRIYRDFGGIMLASLLWPLFFAFYLIVAAVAPAAARVFHMALWPSRRLLAARASAAEGGK